LAALILLVLFVGLWSSGALHNLFAGPKIPIPRDNAGFTFDMNKASLLAQYPKAKKKFRTFNNDPLFSIVTLDPKDGLKGASTVDLLFFKDQLYYISASWSGDLAATAPVEDWAKQYRRWNQNSTSGTERLGEKVELKEWHFNDEKTEMVLRNLNYPDHVEKWRELRDATNDMAQSAFAKYRIEVTN